jgi:hypothetical protein
MARPNDGAGFYVDFAGRTHVNVNALMRDPKVQEIIERMSKVNERFRGKPGVTFIRSARKRD